MLTSGEAVKEGAFQLRMWALTHRRALVAKQEDDMTFESHETDQYGHRRLGGVGDRVASRLKKLSPKFNHGRQVNVLNQRLGYLVRCGDPDAVDSIVPMAFGNVAMDVILSGETGRLISVHNGVYDSVPIELVTGHKNVVDLESYYSTERLRPEYKTLTGRPLFIMTSEAMS